MPITYHPAPGTVLICDFGTGFQKPEMVKRRPVVVISPRPRRVHQLCTIVPLSTTVPDPVEAFHHRLDPKSLPGKFAENETWAKCDMLATVALQRLDRVKLGKGPDGKRMWVSHIITAEDFAAIRRAVLCGIGLNHLTPHL